MHPLVPPAAPLTPHRPPSPHFSPEKCDALFNYIESIALFDGMGAAGGGWALVARGCVFCEACLLTNLVVFFSELVTVDVGYTNLKQSFDLILDGIGCSNGVIYIIQGFLNYPLHNIPEALTITPNIR